MEWIAHSDQQARVGDIVSVVEFGSPGPYSGDESIGQQYVVIGISVGPRRPGLSDDRLVIDVDAHGRTGDAYWEIDYIDPEKGDKYVVYAPVIEEFPVG